MQRTTTPALPGTTVDPNCPDSDDLPMSETDFHALAVILLRQALEDYFAGHADVYVASNMMLYYERGVYRYHRDPDVLVARGVGKHQRRSFRTWEEKTVPRVVFEIASEKTWESDLYAKPEVYQGVGIPEYFLFDPEGCFLKPTLQGFRLVKGLYDHIPQAPDGSLESQELGLHLVAEDNMLRLIDARTDTLILTRSEQAEAQRQLADQLKRRADEHQRHAVEEKRRADHLAAEVERLRKLLQHGDTSNGGQG